MNQHVAKVERIDLETGEITEVSSSPNPSADQADAPATETAAVEAVAVPDAAKRKFPVTPVLKAAVPALPTPAADRIDPNWGIGRYATRGAMHLERYFVMSEKLLWPSVLIALLAVILIFNGVTFSRGMFSGLGGGSGGSQLLIMFIPFFIIGVAVGVLCVGASGMEYEEPMHLYLASGVVVGLPLLILWMQSVENPNSTAAWVLSGVKLAVAIGLILWIGNHILKVRRAGESRMVLWMAGVYVAFVVIGSVVLTSLTGAMSGLAPGGMRSVAAMLTFDRDSYFDLGGGLRSGPEYRWMEEFAPNGGLSVAKLNMLIASVRSDYAKHSNDAGSWEEVTKLDPQPMITRAEKALRDNSKELANGIVIIPEGRGPISIVAHVDGQWSISVVAASNCAVFLGPFDPSTGCENTTSPSQPLNGYVRQILDEIKPIPAAETKE